MVDGILTVVVVVAGILRWLLTSEYGLQEAVLHGRRDERLGGPGQGAMFDQALESGIVPARADRMAWIRELRDEHPTPAVVRFLDLVIAGSVLGKFVSSFLTESLDELTPFVWIAAVAAGVIGLWFLINRLRGGPQDERARLLSTLEGQTSAYRVVDDLRSGRSWTRIARRIR